MKQLFRLFEVPDLPQNRKRAELANRAIASGVVSHAISPRRGGRFTHIGERAGPGPRGDWLTRGAPPPDRVGLQRSLVAGGGACPECVCAVPVEYAAGGLTVDRPRRASSGRDRQRRERCDGVAPRGRLPAAPVGGLSRTRCARWPLLSARADLHPGSGRLSGPQGRRRGLPPCDERARRCHRRVREARRRPALQHRPRHGIRSVFKPAGGKFNAASTQAVSTGVVSTATTWSIPAWRSKGRPARPSSTTAPRFPPVPSTSSTTGPSTGPESAGRARRLLERRGAAAGPPGPNRGRVERLRLQRDRRHDRHQRVG